MKRSMFRLLFIPAGILLLAGSCCRKAENSGAEAIKAADRHYSAMSARQGMNAAFLAMFADSGVILRRNHMPVEGIAAIRELLMQEEDTSFTLTWEPLKSEIASSGELGYSYGIYKIISVNSLQPLGEGTYTTIWRKDAGGEWKAILDTGNSGLKPPAENK